ncbi:hypothetical protein D7B24_007089 [Verticillium nonalfalfae]|uniref:Elongator complex protein 5 n=1 Tax=Verticillium nonalfalfae TaxID=1051616 RepID=A0A3M9Y9G7_9PEZI|nr:uncharacterized protein D7B24_007089 [Verticillium nonalfalfae]RNJ56602.1 hypothetical protein D7B24_007089 [Verticillium nonalfalfae]
MPSAQSHSRSHSLLLLQKLLNLRDGSSPLTLVLDNLEQSATPVIREFVTRAKIGKSKVIFLSFATLKKPRDIDVFVKGRGKTLTALRTEILSHYPKPDEQADKAKRKPSQRESFSFLLWGNLLTCQTPGTLVLLDSLNDLATAHPHDLPGFLSSLLSPATSLVAVYHTDVPLLLPPAAVSEYEPHPLTTLSHLATALLRLSALSQETARQRARDRALQEPEFGLAAHREGGLLGLQSEARTFGAGAGATAADAGTTTTAADARAAVVDMELRRRSGRAVRERFVLYAARDGGAASRVGLLADHAAFAPPAPPGGGGGGGAEGGAGQDEGEPASTFSLGLTEKQRRDRDGIVLPYFDAQTDIGAGEGGRILYEMGREDDFDDEEDEI